MTTLLFAPEALDDLERIFDFNGEAFDEAFAVTQLGQIRSGVHILEDFPRSGRRLRGSSLRELVLQTTRRTGFIVLYEFDEHDDVVRIIAIRHQREGFYR